MLVKFLAIYFYLVMFSENLLYHVKNRSIRQENIRYCAHSMYSVRVLLKHCERLKSTPVSQNCTVFFINNVIIVVNVKYALNIITS